MLVWTTTVRSPRSANSSAVPRTGEEPALVLESLGLDDPDALELGRAEDHAGSRDSLRQVNASAYRVARLHAAHAQQPAEELVVEPVLVALARDDARSSKSQLLRGDLVAQRDEDVRRPQVAVVLRDLVLEDEVVAERVPRELAREAVILVEVVTRACVSTRSGSIGLQFLEDLLDRLAGVREEGVAKLVQSHVGRRRAGEERLGARTRLVRRARRRPRARPSVTSTSGSALVKASRVPPQPISMSSGWQPIASTRRSRFVADAKRRLSIRLETLRRASGVEPGNAAVPVSTIVSRSCLSFIVSIGAQKPSYR